MFLLIIYIYLLAIVEYSDKILGTGLLQTLWQHFLKKSYMHIKNLERQMLFIFRLRMKLLHLIIYELWWIHLKLYIACFSKCGNLQSISPEKQRFKSAYRSSSFFFFPSGLTSCTEFWLFPSRIGERPSRVWVQSSRREGIQHGLIYPSTSWRWTSCQRWESTCEFVFPNQFVSTEVGLLTYLLCLCW